MLIGTPHSLAPLDAAVAAEGDAHRVGARVAVGPGASTGPDLLMALAPLHRANRFAAAIVSLPRAMSDLAQRVSAACRALDIPERRVPTLADCLAPAPLVGRDAGGSIDFAALIGRPPRPTDRAAAERCLAGRRILITGAGGSIGSELARRCADFSPALLILMERSENALFEIDRQIGALYPGVARRAVLHDVVDAPLTRARVLEHRPEIVFHAAAHKHVPMMEDHPAAAVNNNFFGTRSIADASLEAGVRRFVMISTDKAVNPTSVMGATKRMAELYVRGLNREARRRGGSSPFCLVRFGNVLGSACSVLPIWSAQIGEGGPVTVTHPDMTRYFMSIPEAAALVIQAAALDGAANLSTGHAAPSQGKAPEGGGEVFVLDMGAPVSIAALARRFVEAHGLAPRWEDPRGIAGSWLAAQAAAPARPGSSIAVRFTGPRPGEKMHEELAYAAEELAPTAAPGVLSWRGDDQNIDRTDRVVTTLEKVRYLEDRTAVLGAIRSLTPEMRESKTQEERWSVAAA